MELDLKICEYNLYDNHYPGYGYTYNLYIPLPRGQTAPVYRNRLKELMNLFVEHDFFQQYRIIIPTVPGGKEIVGSCFITFDDNVNRDAIVFAKIYLHNLEWGPDLPGKKVKCLWAHDRS